MHYVKVEFCSLFFADGSKPQQVLILISGDVNWPSHSMLGFAGGQIKIATCHSVQEGSVAVTYIGENHLHKDQEENAMRLLMLAITLVALIAYTTTIIGCKSSGTPTGSGYSYKDRKAHHGSTGYSPPQGL